MALVLLSIMSVLALCVTGVVFIATTAGRPGNSPPLGDEAFKRVYEGFLPAPALKGYSSYGYPAFTVTFSSRADMIRASTVNEEFKRELNVRFRGYGIADRRFNAEQAVFFTYPGHIDEMAASAPSRSVRMDYKQTIH